MSVRAVPSACEQCLERRKETASHSPWAFGLVTATDPESGKRAPRDRIELPQGSRARRLTVKGMGMAGCGKTGHTGDLPADIKPGHKGGHRLDRGITTAGGVPSFERLLGRRSARFSATAATYRDRPNQSITCSCKGRGKRLKSCGVSRSSASGAPSFT